MSVFSKLQRGDRTPVVVLDAPISFESHLEAVEADVVRAIPDDATTSFLLAFVLAPSDVARVAAELGSVPGDAVIWFAYPKKSSKRYTSTISRDVGWEPLGIAGFEPVRQVALDQDWSALRFRRVSYIRTLRRSTDRALSDEGRARTRRDRR